MQYGKVRVAKRRELEKNLWFSRIFYSTAWNKVISSLKLRKLLLKLIPEKESGHRKLQRCANSIAFLLRSMAKLQEGDDFNLRKIATYRIKTTLKPTNHQANFDFEQDGFWARWNIQIERNICIQNCWPHEQGHKYRYFTYIFLAYFASLIETNAWRRRDREGKKFKYRQIGLYKQMWLGDMRA